MNSSRIAHRLRILSASAGRAPSPGKKAATNLELVSLRVAPYTRQVHVCPWLVCVRWSGSICVDALHDNGIK